MCAYILNKLNSRNAKVYWFIGVSGFKRVCVLHTARNGYSGYQAECHKHIIGNGSAELHQYVENCNEN